MKAGNVGLYNPMKAHMGKYRPYGKGTRCHTKKAEIEFKRLIAAKKKKISFIDSMKPKPDISRLSIKSRDRLKMQII